MNPTDGEEGGTGRGLEDLLVRCLTALSPGQAQWTAHFVPGRIEVLGKHTDYAGGRSLLAAVDRGFCLVAVPRDYKVVRVIDAVGKREATLPLTPDLVGNPGEWSNYPATVVRRLARDFPGALKGADIAFASDLPAAAGLSSSSALVIGTCLALASASGLSGDQVWKQWLETPESLAAYLAAIESGATYGPFSGDEGVGTHGGSEDHTAILCGRAGALVQYSFAPTRFEGAIPLPPDLVFLVAASGVIAEKTGAARERYNRASATARHIAALWRQAGHGDEETLGAIVASGKSQELRVLLARAGTAPFERGDLLTRLDQFEAESTRIIPAAAAALAAGNLTDFGSLVDESQAWAERALGNQVPETIHLARSARSMGAVAASAFGAGFGGSVWALVPRAEADQFARAWRDDYLERFPNRESASFFTCSPSGPAARVQWEPGARATLQPVVNA